MDLGTVSRTWGTLPGLLPLFFAFYLYFYMTLPKSGSSGIRTFIFFFKLFRPPPLLPILPPGRSHWEYGEKVVV